MIGKRGGATRRCQDSGERGNGRELNMRCGRASEHALAQVKHSFTVSVHSTRWGLRCGLQLRHCKPIKQASDQTRLTATAFTDLLSFLVRASALVHNPRRSQESGSPSQLALWSSLSWPFLRKAEILVPIVSHCPGPITDCDNVVDEFRLILDRASGDHASDSVTRLMPEWRTMDD